MKPERMNKADALVTAATQLVAEFDQHGEVLQIGNDDEGDLGLYGPTSAIEQLRTALTLARGVTSNY